MRFQKLEKALDRETLQALFLRIRRVTSSAAQQLGLTPGAREGGDGPSVYNACGLSPIAHDLYSDAPTDRAATYVSHSEADDDAIILRPLGWVNTTSRADALREILRINAHLPSGGLALAKTDRKELVVFVDHLVISSLDESELRSVLVAASVAGARCGVEAPSAEPWFCREVPSTVADAVSARLLQRGSGWQRCADSTDGLVAWVRPDGAPVVATYDGSVGVLTVAREICGFVGRPALEAAERFTVANLTLLDCAVGAFRSGERGILALVGRLCCDDLDGPELDRLVASFEHIPNHGAQHLRPAEDVLALLSDYRVQPVSVETQVDVSPDTEDQSELRLGAVGDDPTFAIPVTDLLTHVFVCGASGSGKTVACKNLIEEAALAGVPSIVVDLKGDLSSLACVPAGVSREDISAYLVKLYGDAADVSADAIADHVGKMEAGYRKQGINAESLAAFESRVRYRVLAPRADFGVPISLSPLQGLDLDAVDTADGVIGNRELHEALEATIANLVKHIRLAEVDEETLVSVLIQLIQSAHRNGRTLTGINGIQTLVRMLYDTADHVQKVNFLATDCAIGSKQAEKYARAMNAKLGGTFRYWFDGHEFSIDDLIDREDGRVPINIVNLSALQTQSDQTYAIAQLNARIVSWMRRQPGAQRPRLIYYIDEIAQSGGNGAIFPPHPYNPITKPGLTTLLKQGRAFGVSCLLATQNAKDIDYKGLGQCDTWIVGKIKTDADVDRLKLGLESAQLDPVHGADAQLEDIVQEVASLDTGAFVIRTKGQGVQKYGQKWIRSFHERLSPQMLRNWLKASEIAIENRVAKAMERWNDREYRAAIEMLQDVISRSPYFSRLSEAKLQLCEWLFRMREWSRLVDDAADLRKSVTTRRGFERVHYYEGMGLFECQRFEDARSALRRFIENAAPADTELADQCGKALQDVLLREDDYGELEELVEERASSAGREPSVVSRIVSFCRVMRGALRVWPGLRGKLDDVRVIEDASAGRVRYATKAERDVREYVASIQDRIGTLIAYRMPAPWSDDELRSIAGVMDRVALDERRVAERRAEIHELLRDAEERAKRADFAGASARLDSARARVLSSGLCRDDFDRVLSIYRGHAARAKDSLRDWLLNIDPIEFEFETAALLRRLGYEAQATKASGDGGVDVFAQYENRRVVVQCKRYRHPIVPGLIREFATVIRNFDADSGMFVTTSTFSEGCQEEARRHGIRLIDLDGLVQLYERQEQLPKPVSNAFGGAAPTDGGYGSAILDKVMEVLGDADGPLAARNISELSGAAMDQCRPLIRALVEEGRVEQLGRGRGTRYALVARE